MKEEIPALTGTHMLKNREMDINTLRNDERELPLQYVDRTNEAKFREFSTAPEGKTLPKKQKQGRQDNFSACGRDKKQRNKKSGRHIKIFPTNAAILFFNSSCFAKISAKFLITSHNQWSV